jgi:hypothetical protein
MYLLDPSEPTQSAEIKIEFDKKFAATLRLQHPTDTSAYRLSEMTTNSGTEKRPPTPVTDSSMSSKSIEVLPLPDEAPAETVPVAPSEGGSDAPRKHKRRSGNSVDLTYRYDEPSDDELSWTEDEHGTRRRRKSKKTRGGGDDFKTGIMFVRVKSEF